MGRLDGKVAIVTGAARGIGAQIAEAFCREGAAVLVVDVLEADGRATVERLRGDGASAAFVAADVASEAGWERIVAGCREQLGRPGVLVNNAAVNRAEALVDETLEGWSSVLAVNLTGPFLGMRAVIPELIAGGGGSIVNVSSTFGLIGVEAAAAYQASKGGLTILTKHAAVTYAPRGVRVNSIHPGLVDAPMATEIMGPDEIAREISRHPLGRMGKPAEIAAAAVFLASDEAAFVTGAAFPVDGGYTAR